MAKSEMIRARVEPDLKHKAEEVFSTLGLSATEAITLFYKQVTLQSGLPFEVKIPNAETLKALKQARNKKGLIEYNSVDKLMADLDDA
jgi:DNA-damage-inducible protein J